MTMPGDTDKRIEPTDPLGEGSAAGSDLAGSGHLRIAADGTWYHEGRPIPRKKLVQLFASVLRRDDDGRYWLKTPVETVPIEVEDAPFVAVELSRRGAGQDQALALRTNLDDWVPLDAAHPLEVHEDPVSAAPRPYIRVKDGLDALVARSVFYELADLAEPSGEDTLGVWSHGTFFPLGRTGTD